MVTDNRKNFCNPVGACIARPPEQGWIFCRTSGVTQSVGAIRESPERGKKSVQTNNRTYSVGVGEDSPNRGNVCEADKRVMAKP